MAQLCERLKEGTHMEYDLKMVKSKERQMEGK